ncbi:hypothetical protein [Novosphingobium mangrovi (ex Huang et al. 2023)]|uniref:Porin domain-containing protein n=1 Tax=Novosphingobium mangrovi (ex Huang et al. 2023) TaxID=2976432 RepID=A0ABT2I5F8_9SPHN|nr:hypothetical protein [Novosphingobium mangrovi (ex Huang et al. 2023)]MCT2400044.1 hypothetical protein [Novosphingobium mangrovi (ex Huang et al. 2023)]
MGLRGHFFVASALVVAFVPLAAYGQDVAVESAIAATPALQQTFDLGQAARLPVVRTGGAAPRTDPFAEDAEVRTKVKLRLRYQPVEGGPRFEVGTYGSRKGAMKGKLLHVALDWSF